MNRDGPNLGTAGDALPSRNPPTRMSPVERQATGQRAIDASAAASKAAARCASLSLDAPRDTLVSDEAYAPLLVAREELEATVRGYARLLRVLGTPPERMLLLLKETVRERVPSHGVEARAIMEDVVRWGVKAYYDEDIA